MSVDASSLLPVGPETTTDAPAEVAVQAGGRRRAGRASVQLWVSAGLLILIAGACFIWPLIYSLPSPYALVGNGAVPIFSPGHLLGTDELGRDMLSRTLYGGRVSIEVGLGSVGIGFAIGGSLGMFAGYLGGKLDVVISRLLDMFLAFPALVLALAVAAYLGPSERDEIFAIAFFTIPGTGRYTRGATMRLREEEFLAANQILGGKARYIIYRHVLPNILGTLLTFGVLGIGGAMLAEAGLSFLGAGIRPPQPSWGNMISEGQNYLSSVPHIFLVPSCFLFVTILSVNLLGDAVRRRFRL